MDSQPEGAPGVREDDSAESGKGSVGLDQAPHPEVRTYVSDANIMRIIQQNSGSERGTVSATQRDYDFKRVRELLEAPAKPASGKLPPTTYSRGLAARALAFLMEAVPSYAVIIRNSSQSVTNIMRVLNQVSAESQCVAEGRVPSLSPADASRIALNCAGALGQIFSATGRTSHFRLDIRSGAMHMNLEPEPVGIPSNDASRPPTSSHPSYRNTMDSRGRAISTPGMGSIGSEGEGSALPFPYRPPSGTRTLRRLAYVD